MPEFQMAGAWVEKPCLFRLPDEAVAAAACNHCNESFTFFNGRRYCDFCGYTFHRAEGCIQKLRIDGELLRRRICSQCDFYRNVAGRKLCEGEKFTCYRKGRPTEVAISLSEETGEVLFEWISQGVTESLDLQSLQVQKGFSHAGHVSTADYDPLKSLSLLATKDDVVKAVDLKAPSAWICQMWVKGLTAAKYVHQRMVEQQEALEWCTAEGEKVYYDCWFRTNYLPTGKKGSRSAPSLRRYKRNAMSAPPCASTTSSIESAVPSFDPDEEFEELSISECDSSHLSSHEATPLSSPSPETSLRSRVSHTQPIPTTSSSRMASPKWSHSRRSLDFDAATPQLPSTPHLPYRQSPLSSICGCHAYEIAPSKCIHVHARSPKSTPKHKCCSECELACQIALDLVNL